MIIDSFLFFQEYDMLEFRLKLLYEHVDKFVIVESSVTHSGHVKPLNYWQHRERYKWAEDKIIYYPFTPDIEGLDVTYRPKSYEPDSPHWKLENTQRQAIMSACRDFSDNDILMVSDCDEIPAPTVVEFRKKHDLLYPMACQQQVSVFGLDFICPVDWRGTTIARLGYARVNGTQGMRNMRNRFSVMPGAGWHLTYFGGEEAIKTKLRSFAHQEFNKEEFFKNIPEAIKTGGAIFPEGTPTVRASQADYPDYFLKLAPKDWWLNSVSDAERVGQIFDI